MNTPLILTYLQWRSREEDPVGGIVVLVEHLG